MVEWKLVPLEPTKEMIEAGDTAAEDCLDSDWDSGSDGESYNTYTYLRSDAPAIIYRAMLAAAPRTDTAQKQPSPADSNVNETATDAG